eukprot:COSAG01_NODE_1911_length_8925_cov_151.747111_2_plen_63_part_00
MAACDTLVTEARPCNRGTALLLCVLVSVGSWYSIVVRRHHITRSSYGFKAAAGMVTTFNRAQ